MSSGKVSNLQEHIVSLRLPIGTRVRVLGAAEKVDKQYRGMTGTVIDYGLPVSRFDHLVHLDQTRESRWFAATEISSLEV